jgi:hypothetical protein
MQHHAPRQDVPQKAITSLQALLHAGSAVARGSVIDFMNVGLGSLRTGIFNVADVAILGGLGFLLFAHFKPSHEHTSKPSHHEEAEGL